MRGGGGGLLSKGQTPPLIIGGQKFYRQREGAACRAALSALTVFLKLVVGWSGQCHLVVLSTVNLQFRSWFVHISLTPVLRIVAAYVIAPTVQSSCG